MQSKYEWDFGLLYKTEEDRKKDLEFFKLAIKDIKNFEGKLNNKKDIVEYLKATETLMKKVYRLDLYAMMKMDQDSTSAENVRISDVLMNLITEYSVASAFVSPELSANSNEFLLELQNDKELSDYKRFFEAVIREKQHTLSKDKEELLAGISNFTDFSELFEKLANVEIKFDDIIDKDGNHLPLTNSTYTQYVLSEDAEIRRQGHENLHKGFAKYNLTLSNNFVNFLKKCDFIAKTYNFKSQFEKSLFGEEVSQAVYDKLVENVRNNLPLYQQELKEKAKCLGMEKLAISDVIAPVGKPKNNIAYEDAVKIVLDMVKVMGEDYHSVASTYFNNRSIDVYPKEGKRSGAYSASAQIGQQFMLLNYDGTYNSVSTLAHELGHTMHSYFSEKTQPYFTQDYVIFVAEVASTVNEVLLANKLMKESQDKEERRFLAESILNEFNSSVFRQTMFSEFEQFAHGEINQGNPVSFEELNNKYASLQNEYFGDSVNLHEFAKFEWSRIPHFYRRFYVYKYATGFVAAVSIASNIEKYGADYVKNNYIKFLSAGSSMDPVSILKLANVDITSDEPYKNAFKFYSDMIKIINE